MDIVNGIGGFIYLMSLIIGFLVYPIQEHKFFMSAIDKLYKAQTSDNDLFSYESFRTREIIPTTFKVMKEDDAAEK